MSVSAIIFAYLDFSFSLLKQMCFSYAPLYPPFLSSQLLFQTSVPQKLGARGLEVMTRAKDMVSRYWGSFLSNSASNLQCRPANHLKTLSSSGFLFLRLTLSRLDECSKFCYSFLMCDRIYLPTPVIHNCFLLMIWNEISDSGLLC